MHIDMKIEPLFDEGSIMLSFYVRNFKTKIGQSVVYSCDRQGVPIKPFIVPREPLHQQLAAQIDHFIVPEELETDLLDRIVKFLHTLGYFHVFHLNRDYPKHRSA